MIVTRYPTAKSFLACAQDMLEEHELVNSLLIGLAMRADPDVIDPEAFYFTIAENGVIFQAAICTPFRYLILSPTTQKESLQALANYCLEQGHLFPGVIGPRSVSLPFAEYWAKKTEQQIQFEMKNLVYELREVIPVNGVPGVARMAKEEDIPVLTQWFQAFAKEAMEREESPEEAEKIARAKLANGQAFVWERDGQVLSLACRARPTRNGTSINYVYTPKASRKNGYAAALVAALSQTVLNAGFQFCTLFTDEEYPTSNRVYQRIGYKEKDKFYNIAFIEKD